MVPRFLYHSRNRRLRIIHGRGGWGVSTPSSSPKKVEGVKFSGKQGFFGIFCIK